MKKMVIILSVLIVITIIWYFKTNYNSNYQIRDGQVYYNGWNAALGKYSHLLEGADSETFIPVKNSKYGKDKTHVYYEEYLIVEADSKTFEFISPYYAKDKNNVYYSSGIIMKGADPTTFSYIDGSYSKDSKDVYYLEKSMQADPNSFVILQEDFSKDKASYYYQMSKIPVADYQSLIIIGGESGSYSKDKINVYSGNKIIIGADPSSFELIKDTALGKDKNGCYFLDEKRDCPK